MIPATGVGLQCTKITNIIGTSEIADVTIMNVIRPLQYTCNLETMMPPRSWPSALPGIKTSPKEKRRKRKHS